MTSQADRAVTFRALHTPSDPLVLYNIWDAGGAAALAKAGAGAVATGSWSVAAAHGFSDGEALPLEMLVWIVGRIAASTELPLSVDFEGGYATDPDAVTDNVRRIIQAGAVGVNFEDRVVQGAGLHGVDTQVQRIKAVRRAAQLEGVDLFINARTDLFLGSDPDTHTAHLPEALARARAYQGAGADGFFVPGLGDAEGIRQIVDTVALPVNVMMTGALTSLSAVASLGVARASFGPVPYLHAMSDLKARFAALT